MTLLIDENLPATTALDCCESVHPNILGQRPTDAELWEIAKIKEWVIVTKDTDFFSACWPSIFAALRDYDLIEVFPQKIEALSFAREEK